MRHSPNAAHRTSLSRLVMGHCPSLRFGLALLVIAAMATPLGCASSRDRGAEPLRVGIAPVYPPIIFEDEGEIIGVEAQLAAMVGAELGRPIKFMRMHREQLIPSVQSGMVDIAMSGISVTPERSKRVLFSVPYLNVGQLALIRIADLAELSQPSSFKRPGVRIGYIDGTTGDDYVATSLPGAQSYAFKTVEEGVRSLRARRIDAFIHDAPTVWRVGAGVDEQELMGLYTPLTDEALAWAIPKKDTELKRQVDEMLGAWRMSGQLDQILNRWIPVRVEVGR